MVGLLVVVASVGSVSAIATHDSESFVTNDVTEANSDAIDATMDVGGMRPSSPSRRILRGH
ncbi:hypothetical protein ACFQL7_14670 [Halocatena marina]|uniref:Uncharacterized protein n=1 Tax=Halocatena marina TaxID=2934937 RepID=A0ABD5YPX9_9EURY